MRTTKENFVILLLGSTIVAGSGGLASAGEFKLSDDITVTSNIQVSAGISFRTENPSSENLLAGNAAQQGLVGVASSGTQDDGNLNFEKGDVVTAPVTVLADLEFDFGGDIGFFIRGKGVYDAALDNKRVGHGHVGNGFARGQQLNDDGFNTAAQFRTADILDAFVFGDVEVAETPIELRLGRQVVSWGEGALIQGGINTINPVDVSAFRRPGVSLKEGLLPLGKAYFNAGVTDNLSLEGFWNFEWQETQLDGCGTFFSTVDVIAQGCTSLSLASLLPTLGLPGTDQFAQGFNSAALGLPPLIQGAFVNRGADRGPNDFEPDQFGVAARYYVEDIDTEFGAYFHRLDSRLPSLSFTSGNPLTPIPGVANLPTLGLAPGAALYNVEYAEDINTVGFSAATTIFGLAVSGEMSYRPNQPVQINTTDLTLGAITAGDTGALLGAPVPPGTFNPADALFNGLAPGTPVQGFIETDQLRGQVSTVAFIDRFLGSDRLTLLGELGFEYLPSLDGDRQVTNPNLPGQVFALNLGRPPIFGGPSQPGNTTEGTTTDFSAGFRGRASATYSNVFAGVNVTPSFAWAQDLVGYSSDGQFIEGRTALNFGLGFDYLNTYNLSLNYTTSFGGTFNGADDRDFASMALTVNF